jgi:hypothetical protein
MKKRGRVVLFEDGGELVEEGVVGGAAKTWLANAEIERVVAGYGA